MPTYIGKIRDRYFEYSTNVGAPVTGLMTVGDFADYYWAKYSESSWLTKAERLVRAAEKGTSSTFYDSLEKMIEGNRYGDGEKPLTLEEFIEKLEGESE